MTATDKKKTPAVLQHDEGQNGNHMGAGANMKTTTTVPGTDGSTLEWAECQFCYSVRTVSANWYGTELRCKHCGQARRHEVLDLKAMEHRCRFYLARLEVAADHLLIADRLTTSWSHQPGLYEVDAYLTEAHPEFHVTIADHLAPWGLLRALKHANRWLIDVDQWTPWLAYDWKTQEDGRRWRGWSMAIRPSDLDDVPGGQEFRDRVICHD